MVAAMHIKPFQYPYGTIYNEITGDIEFIHWQWLVPERVWGDQTHNPAEKKMSDVSGMISDPFWSIAMRTIKATS
jgi:hypothetical protein